MTQNELNALVSDAAIAEELFGADELENYASNQIYLKIWHRLRAQWVNGEQEETKHEFSQMNNFKLRKTVAAALKQHQKLADKKTGVSADLKDLMEILFSL